MSSTGSPVQTSCRYRAASESAVTPYPPIVWTAASAFLMAFSKTNVFAAKARSAASGASALIASATSSTIRRAARVLDSHIR